MKWIVIALLLIHEPGELYAEWFNSLVQPGRHAVSCCGQADQYWVRDYQPSHTSDIAFKATVISKDGSTEFTVDIPANRVLWDEVNPTGRGVLFMSHDDAGDQNVLCFVPASGA